MGWRAAGRNDGIRKFSVAKGGHFIQRSIKLCFLFSRNLLFKSAVYLSVDCIKVTVNEILKYCSQPHRATPPLVEICDAFVLIRIAGPFQVASVAAGKLFRHRLDPIAVLLK
ncbi:hypothetical protein XENORESO_014142 [Xenotaenia resolanae]|uniref:Galectin domain-containing protein n=1 Tax=Xenotaenia resolanae TaxID=208358 RepID=A0ABV0WR12_9TELE